ncbi:hypothetical protein EDB89DRAFT_2234737 [Lactarius sanguifluus]|nr:hypothetical protein EDB89DRAFT_2234737 [Lactarius sanguifluus]
MITFPIPTLTLDHPLPLKRPLVRDVVKGPASEQPIHHSSLCAPSFVCSHQNPGTWFTLTSTTVERSRAAVFVSDKVCLVDTTRVASPTSHPQPLSSVSSLRAFRASLDVFVCSLHLGSTRSFYIHDLGPRSDEDSATTPLLSSPLPSPYLGFILLTHALSSTYNTQWLLFLDPRLPGILLPSGRLRKSLGRPPPLQPMVPPRPAHFPSSVLHRYGIPPRIPLFHQTPNGCCFWTLDCPASFSLQEGSDNL